MRSPAADAAGKHLQTAVVEARRNLTRDAVIFDAVSAAYALDGDPDWKPPLWPGKEAIEAGRAAVRALQPPQAMADPTPRPTPALWRRALLRLAEAGLR